MDPCMGQPPPPDGGWGWFVVFGSFMIHFILGGVVYTFGIFYVELLNYFQSGKEATAWISSILVAFMLCSGPVSSILVNKYGCRTVAIAGSITASISLLASVWAPSVVILYLTIGLGTGVGFGLMYLPTIVSIANYFEKYRSLATNIAVCGLGLGTLVFGPFNEYLINIFGWRGAMMIVSGIVLNGIIFGAMFRPIEPVKHMVSVPIKDLSKIVKQIANRRLSTELTIKNDFDRPDSSSNVDNPKEDCSKSHDDGTIVMGVTPSETIFTTKGFVNNVSGSVEKSFGSYQRDTLNQGTVDNVRRQSEIFACSHENMTRQRASLRSLPDETSYRQNKTLECLPNAEDTIKIVHPTLELLKDPVFLLFTFSNFLTNFGFNVPYVYLVAQAEERGIDKVVASDLLVVIGIADITGRIILGYISGKPWMNRLLLYNLCLTVCGLSTILSTFCDSFLTFALYGIVFAVTGGAHTALAFVVLVELMGLDRFTNALGLILFFQGIAALLGPPIAGWLYDTLNSYDPCFFLAGGTIGISGLIIFFVPPIQRWMQK